MKSNKKFTANLQLVCVGLILTFVCAAGAQTPLANLMKQPSDARHFVIQSMGGKHGDSWMWIDASGHHLGRESMNLRGQVFEVDSEGKNGADGMPLMLTIRGVTPWGDAGETFEISAGTARWKSPADAGTAKYSAPVFTCPREVRWP